MAPAGEESVSHALIPWSPRTTGSGVRKVLGFNAAIIMLHIAVGTAIWMHLLGANAAIGDSFYFAVVTFLTIGYGDITPASPTAKMFFIIYTVASLIVQLTVVSTVLAKTLTWRPPNLHGSQCDSVDAAIKTYYRVRPRIIRALQGLFLITCIVAAGAAMLHVLARHRDLTWIDCWYWSVTTVATVGYGDIVPHHYRPVFAVFFLVAVVVFTYVLGESVALVAEVGKYRRLEGFFAGGLSPEILDSMDAFHDGQVSKVEFMMFMLERLELVDREELDRILDVFNAADAVGDGILSLADIRVCRRCSVHALPGSAFADALMPDDIDAPCKVSLANSTSERDCTPLRQSAALQSATPSAAGDGVASDDPDSDVV